MKSNQDIKTAAKRKGIYLWQIAAVLGINDGNFSRKLRRELPENEKQRLLAIIDDLAAQKEKAAQG